MLLPHSLVPPARCGSHLHCKHTHDDAVCECLTFNVMWSTLYCPGHTVGPSQGLGFVAQNAVRARRSEPHLLGRLCSRAPAHFSAAGFM
jgi:hypothetical protein